MNKFPLLSFLIPGLTEDNGFVLQKTLMKFPLKKERRRKEELLYKVRTNTQTKHHSSYLSSQLQLQLTVRSLVVNGPL